MEKLKISAVIKYFYKKGMPPKGIHEDFMETLGKESPSCSTVEKRTTECKSERERIEDVGLSGRSKMPPLMKMSRSCTPWLCVIGCETCEA